MSGSARNFGLGGIFVLVLAIVACAVPAGKAGTAANSDAVGLLRGGDFDGADAGAWAESSAGGFPIVNGPSRLPFAAHSGGDAAWLGGYANADDTLAQDVTVPAGATGLALAFFLRVRTEHGPRAAAVDLLQVTLEDGHGTVLREVASFSNRDALEAWIARRYEMTDVPSLAGKTVRVVFHGSTDPVALTSFFVDTASFTANVPPAGS